VRRKNNIKK